MSVVMTVVTWQASLQTSNGDLCVCLCPPGHPDRSGQLCDQPVLWLPALAHRSRPGWRICACIRQEDGSKWMVKHTHSPYITHATSDHISFYQGELKVNNNYPAPFTVSPLFKYIQEHTQLFLWALTPTDSYIIHFSNLYLLHIMCCKSPFGGSTSFNGPWWHHIAPVG